MPGEPMHRMSGWLYPGEERDPLPLASVGVFQLLDRSGWEVRVYVAAPRFERAARHYTDEAEAWGTLTALLALGRHIGRWRIRNEDDHGYRWEDGGPEVRTAGGWPLKPPTRNGAKPA